VGDLIGTGAVQERGVVGGTLNLAARLRALARPGTLIHRDGPCEPKMRAPRAITLGIFTKSEAGFVGTLKTSNAAARGGASPSANPKFPA
jgi:hypothetical protein